jgi:hypothetical protein
VASSSESATGFAVVEKDGVLAFSYGKLSAELNITGTIFRDSVHNFSARLIKPFDNF